MYCRTRNHIYIDYEDQRKLAHFISNLLRSDLKFNPYHPDSDKTRWVLDESNNWRLRFHENLSFELTFRYDHEDEYVIRLVKWMQVRMIDLNYSTVEFPPTLTETSDPRVTI